MPTISSAPARPACRCRHGWRLWLLNTIHAIVAVAIVAGWCWMAQRPLALLHLSARMTMAEAAGVGYLAYTFVFCWWHRARHASVVTWRTLHRIHHSRGASIP